MEKKNLIKVIAFNAIIAACYYVLSLPFGELNYGAINFRISEVFIILALYNKKFIPGLVLGCFLVNITSILPLDMLVGTSQTLVACLILTFSKSKLEKINFKYILKEQIGVILAALSCGIMIGAELYFYYEGSLFYHMISVFASELIILEVGYILWILLFKNSTIKKYLTD